MSYGGKPLAIHQEMLFVFYERTIEVMNEHTLTVFVPSGCGRHINEPNGTLESPGYPNNYPSNADCIWVISAPKGHHIELEFKRFDIHKVGGGCRYDYVEIRDGNSRDSPSLGRHCGKSGKEK